MDLMKTGVLLVVLLPVLASADASNGEMAGYRLGEVYALNETTQWQAEADRSLKIEAEAAVKPEGVDKVYVYASPGSYTIGKIIYQNSYPDLDSAAAAAQTYRQRLEAENPTWKKLKTPIPMGKSGGEIVSRQENGPYALIVYYKGLEEGARLVVELEYASRAVEKKAWRQLLREEAVAAEPATEG